MNSRRLEPHELSNVLDHSIDLDLRRRVAEAKADRTHADVRRHLHRGEHRRQLDMPGMTSRARRRGNAVGSAARA